MLYGREALGEAELLALVLGGGNALERSVGLLHELGGLAGVERAVPTELMAIGGVGVAGASAVAAAFELGLRAHRLELPYATPIRAPEDVAPYLRAVIGAEERETFVALGLDARQRVRFVRTVAIGSLSRVDVHPREVFRPLLRAGVHAAIVVHNHPSGVAEPSDADLELTHRLADTGRIVGIPILDHLVVTRTQSVSMAALGLMT
jgi:DNA repair protein RadC